MSLRGVFLATVGAGAAYVLVRAATAQNGGEQPQIMLASLPQEPAPRPSGLSRALPILNSILDLADMTPVFGGSSTPRTTTEPQSAPVGGGLAEWVSGFIGGLDLAPDTATGSSAGGMNIAPLKNIILKHESRFNYDAIWSGIAASDYPPRPITQMTIGEVLAWQDSIDHKYNSEAVGAWQFLEDTLRGLVAQGHARTSERFTPAVQDRLAVALMDRRGLGRYRSGQMSAEAFAQNLAKEWASLPAQTVDRRGRPATGQSYYAGDGLNRAFASKSEVLTAVRAI